MTEKRENISKVLGKIDGLWGDRLVEMLGPTEFLIAGGMAVLEGNNLASAVFCTNERVIQIAEKMVGRDQVSIPLETITSVDESTLLLGIVRLEIRAPNASFQATGRGIKGMGAAINQARQARVDSESTTPATNPDPLAQIEKLGSLLREGVITPEEFEAKKQTYLDQI